MTRSTTAAPDPAPPVPTRPNLKGPGPFRFDLPAPRDAARPFTPGAHRDRAPFAHLPDTPLVIRLRERAVLGEAGA